MAATIVKLRRVQDGWDLDIAGRATPMHRALDDGEPHSWQAWVDAVIEAEAAGDLAGHDLEDLEQ